MTQVSEYSCNCRVFASFPCQTDFKELQPEAMNTQVLKYAKTVYQLEKGLPPNGVVPHFKAKVENMKDKVGTISIACFKYPHG